MFERLVLILHMYFDCCLCKYLQCGALLFKYVVKVQILTLSLITENHVCYLGARYVIYRLLFHKAANNFICPSYFLSGKDDCVSMVTMCGN